MKVRKFAFAYNASTLDTGHTVYTPTVSDVLYDAWIEVVTAWNGTTPQGDFGIVYNTEFNGFLSGSGPGGTSGVLDMTSADEINAFIGGSWLGNIKNMGARDVQTQTMTPSLYKGSSAVSYSASAVFSNPSWLGAGYRSLPCKFTDTSPIQVLVSSDGTRTGGDPGATQGSAILYLVTATPA